MDIKVSKYQEEFLHIASLTEMQELRKVAYVSEVEPVKSNDGGVYARVTLMDCNNDEIVARLFGENYDTIETKIMPLKNKIVIMNFEYEVKGNFKSLKIKTMKPVSEDIITVAEFVQKIDNYLEEIDKFSKRLDSLTRYGDLIAIARAHPRFHIMLEDMFKPVEKGRIGGKVLFLNQCFDLIEKFKIEEKAKIILFISMMQKDYETKITMFSSLNTIIDITSKIKDTELRDEICNFYLSTKEVETPSTITNAKILEIYNMIFRIEKLKEMERQCPSGGFKYYDKEGDRFLYNI